MREQESDFERLVGQNLWRLESLVKQVGDFASSGKADAVPCGEEPTRVFPGAVFEILLHIGGGLAAQLILTVVQNFFLMAVPAVQGRVVARSPWRRWHSSVIQKPGTHLAFGCMDNPYVWHEVTVTWSFLCADQAVSVLTPGDGHYVGLMAGASAGSLCALEFAAPTKSVMLFRMAVLIDLDRGPRAIDSLVSLMKNVSRSRPMDRVLIGRWGLLDAKGRQRPFPILDDDAQPVEGIGDGSTRNESVSG